MAGTRRISVKAAVKELCAVLAGNAAADYICRTSFSVEINIKISLSVLDTVRQDFFSDLELCAGLQISLCPAGSVSSIPAICVVSISMEAPSSRCTIVVGFMTFLLPSPSP